jgi:NAD(P)-dependent dehydrogenase (short-subunit alcohol dehydrogenase family)
MSLPVGSGEHAVIVTGVSRGLGAALAEDLLGRGFMVVGIGRASHPSLIGQRYQFARFDLSELTGLDMTLTPLLQALKARRPASVSLVNNAAGGSFGVLGRRTADDITYELTVNLVAVVALVNVFCRIFDDAQMPRRVLNVSSGAARTPLPGMGVYCVAKAGVEMLTVALATEHQEPTFRAIAVRPGVMDTGMQADARSQPPDLLPCVELFQGLHRRGQLTPPAVTASKIVTRLIVGDVEHGRIYTYEDL